MANSQKTPRPCIKYLFIWLDSNASALQFPAKKSCDFNEFQKFDIFIPYFRRLIWLSKWVGVVVWNDTRSLMHTHVDVTMADHLNALRIQIRCDEHWPTLCHEYFGLRILCSATSAYISYHSRASELISSFRQTLSPRTKINRLRMRSCPTLF